MHRRHALSCVVAGLLLVHGGARVSAQTVQGTIVDRDGSTPVPGVVVLLLDAADAIVSRALSREEGRFQLRARSGGTYRLRALRIGYSPTTTPRFVVADTGTTRAQITLSGAAVRLDAIRVVGRSSCRVRPDSSQSAFKVWEEARKALAASVLSDAVSTYTVEIASVRRTLDLRGRMQSETRVPRYGSARQPFASISAESLSMIGYVVRDGLGATYYAPDAEVLLSDRFADSHCLRLMSPPRDTGQAASWIGIGFAPVDRHHPARADVEGVIWLDATSAELRELEFRYVNVLPIEASVEPGGRVIFLRLATGTWMIRDWSIRMPVLAMMSEVAASSIAGPRLGSLATLRVLRVDEQAGEVLSVAARGRTLWARQRVSLVVRVVDSASSAAVAGARVHVDGATRQVMTDSSGRAQLDSVVPGPHWIHILVPTGAKEESREIVLEIDVPERPDREIVVRTVVAPVRGRDRRG